MSRLTIETRAVDAAGHERLSALAGARLAALPPEQCPVDLTVSLTRLYLSESCGKCTPCRVGLAQCAAIMDRILAGEGKPADVDVLRKTAQVVYDSADCAIGFEAGRTLLAALDSFAGDFASHVEDDFCTRTVSAFAPCRATCPAHIDIPGYLACVRAGRDVDALRVIRNDNPLPTVCGYVCEHPCEINCRRALVDSSVNICGIKRYAADNAPAYDPPACAPATGKRVSIVGGGPAGLSAAYYLALMGHDVTVYDQREKLGGMVRYGIPDYRLPQDKLDADVDFVLRTGVKVVSGCAVGTDVPFSEVSSGSDAVYLSIGAHLDKKLGCEGEDAAGVMSAVTFLRAAGAGAPVDLAGKRVCVVGGGNVAMDCTRTARRLGAASVECVYRRRIADMTALPEEIEEAQAEGCQITQLEAPVRIEADAAGRVVALITQPQIIGAVGRGGRPAPRAASVSEHRIACDVVIVAIGQAIDVAAFEGAVKTEWGCIVANEDGSISQTPGLFAGGDAVSGPSTVIKAIAAGKVAAANIDVALGFSHDVHDEVDVPPAHFPLGPTGRVELRCVPFAQAATTFDLAKLGMSAEEAFQETSRCLRCDHHGFGATCRKEELAW
ncbi:MULTISPECIES: NAD(P)-binding protein [unclassified Adlercreutzia]|uniref:NAD(P)-binding protein n=1 Tax=unclassified Adlercreutzia TaxID=2636013 RepID=UPI0013EC9AD0|nr:MULTISPECIES: NAD(P)-binding protein [unclassified Adlercreutzia]